MNSTRFFFEDLDGERMSRLMKLGMGGASPVDELLDEAPAQLAGHVAHMLTRGPLKESEQDQLVAGGLPVERIKALREHGKRVLSNARRRGEREQATLAYLLAVASALVHHGTLISSQSAEELEQPLLALSELLPNPWNNLMLRATAALRDGNF